MRGRRSPAPSSTVRTGRSRIAPRSAAASCSYSVALAVPVRMARAMRRLGAGSAKRAVRRRSARLVSTSTAVRGSRVTPRPPATSWTSVESPAAVVVAATPALAGLAADVESLVAQTVPFVEQQQVQLAQHRAGYAVAPAEPVPGRGDQHEVLVEQGKFGDPGDAERHGEQQQVEPSRGQPVEQARGVLLVHLEVEARIAVVDQPQHRRQQVRRHGRDDTEPQHPGEGRPQRVRLLHERADLREHGLRAGRELLPGRGEQHSACRTLHQRHAERLLQRGQRPGQRGLTHPQSSGGVAEVQMLGHRRERPQLRQARLPAPVTDSH